MRAADDLPPQRHDLAPNAVARWAAEAPDRVFLQHVDGRRLSYARVDDEREG